MRTAMSCSDASRASGTTGTTSPPGTSTATPMRSASSACANALTKYAVHDAPRRSIAAEVDEPRARALRDRRARFGHALGDAFAHRRKPAGRSARPPRPDARPPCARPARSRAVMSRGGAAAVARETREQLTDLRALAFGHEDLRQHAVVRRLDVGVHLVGLDREQRLAAPHACRPAACTMPTRRRRRACPRASETRRSCDAPFGRRSAPSAALKAARKRPASAPSTAR